MIDEDIERLQNALAVALEFALDGSGRLERVVHERESTAYFFGISSGWRSGTRELVGVLKKVNVELVRASPSVCAVVPDLEDPIQRAEVALEGLRTAIEDVQGDQPAMPLWESMRDETEAAIRELRAGRVEFASCAACRAPFYDNPAQLQAHFRNGHPPPQLGDRLFIPVADQWRKIQEAAQRYRDAYEAAITALTWVQHARTSGEEDPSIGGRPHHIWRDVIKAKFLERVARSEPVGTQVHEVEELLEWARAAELPPDPAKPPPSAKTVANWIREDWQAAHDRGAKPSSKG